MRLIHVSVAVLVLALTGSSARAQSDHQPAEAGTWYLSGGSTALFESVDGGDFADSDLFGFSVSGGYFLLDGLLLQALVEYTDATQESGVLDLDETTYTLAGGLRYYFIQEGVTRPYLGAAIGLRSLDEEIDNGAQGILSDSDTYTVLRGEVGLELMIARSVSIDLGLVAQEEMDVHLFDTTDDVSTVGLFVGLSAWL